MSTGPKKRFGSTLTQPVAPTPDELMFGAVSPLPLPPAGIASASLPAVVAPPAGPTGRWVPFGLGADCQPARLTFEPNF